MKTTLARWLDSDVGYSFRTSPMAMVAAAIALICVFWFGVCRMGRTPQPL